MSDNLHFEQVIDTGTPSNSSGESGFPFRIYNLADVGGVTVGNGGTHPLLLPLEVQNSLDPSHAREFWRGKTLIVSTDLADLAGPTSLPIGTFPKLFSWTRELDHITSPDRLWRYNVFPFDITIQLHSGFGIVFDDPNYYMQLSINGSIASQNSGALSSITATFDTCSFTLFYDPAFFTMSFFDLQWSDFWPYEFDGNPIYDTTTGLELQDPKL